MNDASKKINQLELKISDQGTVIKNQLNDNQLDDNQRYKKLTEIKYKDKVYSAYHLFIDDRTPIMESTRFIIMAENDPSGIWSNFLGDFYSTDTLFAVYTDNMFVINSKNNSIDVYKLIDRTGDVYIDYSESLKLPKYKTGALYGIECSTNTCTVKTAFHQEAGCTITLNPRTKVFSIPVCRKHMGPPYTPERN